MPLLQRRSSTVYIDSDLSWARSFFSQDRGYPPTNVSIGGLSDGMLLVLYGQLYQNRLELAGTVTGGWLQHDLVNSLFPCLCLGGLGISVGSASKKIVAAAFEIESESRHLSYRSSVVSAGIVRNL